MESFAEFRESLAGALNHLYDSAYQPTVLLYTVLGCAPEAGVGPLQSELMRQIRSLDPGSDQPANARPRRTYDVLHHRFVLKLTQQETAFRLHMNERTMRREQKEAIHVLARHIWEQYLARFGNARGPTESTADWRRQLRDELASLRASSPLRVADVSAGLDAAVSFGRTLTSGGRTRLELRRAPSNLSVALHPTALRQILIIAVTQLLPCVTDVLTIDAYRQDNTVAIDLSGARAAEQSPLATDLLQELLTAEDSTLAIEVDDQSIRCQIRLPGAGEVTVLVVEDNDDAVHYYERCTAGTRYRIVHAQRWEDALAAIAATAPSAIVLDIMLPSTDGWDLLRQLRANPATRSIPVIVCSIVAQQELAAALGAVRCLPKPIPYRAFLQALDEATSERAALTSPASNAADRRRSGPRSQ